MDWELDFGGKTAQQFEREAGKIPPGYYFATFDKDEDSDKNGAKTLHFSISRGDQKGRKTNLILSHPRFAEDEKKANDAAKRMAAIATRMGAVGADASGKVRTNFAACINKEYILKIVHREGRDGGVFANVEYMGVYPVDGHDDIADKDRGALGLPLKKDRKAAEGATAPVAPNPAAAAAKLWG